MTRRPGLRALCGSCGAALPDEAPPTCPTCRAPLNAGSVAYAPAPTRGVRLIAWLAIGLISALLAAAIIASFATFQADR